MSETNWKEIAEELYFALSQSRRNRGIDYGDVEIVMGAMYQYEKASNMLKRTTYMWMEHYPPSEPSFVTTCIKCKIKTRFTDRATATMWVSRHECSTEHRPEGEPIDVEHEE